MELCDAEETDGFYAPRFTIRAYHKRQENMPLAYINRYTSKACCELSYFNYPKPFVRTYVRYVSGDHVLTCIETEE